MLHVTQSARWFISQVDNSSVLAIKYCQSWEFGMEKESQKCIWEESGQKLYANPDSSDTGMIHSIDPKAMKNFAFIVVVLQWYQIASGTRHSESPFAFSS